MATRGKRTKNSSDPAPAKSYTHKDQTALMRPDVGTQAQFKKRKEPVHYAYDHPIPLLQWDGHNPAREQGEALIREILEAGSLDSAKLAAEKLKRMSQPFLEWTGKKERASFDVPTLPLFVHERLSTKAIIDTLQGHKRDKQMSLDLFGDPEHSITDQVLKAYEHQDRWVNRMILGDSQVVMNSLLQYEGMAGKVQMIFYDPPYGVRFGSNFQPFVRSRDVSHGDDAHMSREPEMVQAYRDTWERGVHSYLTHLRDRFTLCRELLANSGSLFVQIGDENVHVVRSVLEEVFGADSFVGIISFVKTTNATANFLPGTTDFILWFARDIERLKYNPLYIPKEVGSVGATNYNRVAFSDGTTRPLTPVEKENLSSLPPDARIYSLDNLTSQSMGRDKGEGAACWFPVEVKGKQYRPNLNSRWKTNEVGMDRLKAAKRLEGTSERLGYVRYFDDFPFFPITNNWTDVGASFMADKLYVVQTTPKVVQRCMLMTTDPGDLVLDPTCGSGTTAFVAEQWARRWITMDVSRVPLALARQRLLTATFPYYSLVEEDRPGAGFAYSRRRNSKGEEVGGIVPHVTLRSIAQDEPPEQEVMVDRPDVRSGIVRVTGPFCFESTIPAPTLIEDQPEAEPASATHTERMLEILRKSPVIRLPGNRTVTFKNVRQPAKALSLSAEATVENGKDKVVAFVFGPENGAVSEKLVYDAAREANLKGYKQLFVIGFAVEAKARTFIEQCADVVGVPAVWVQATTDLTMSDLLKTMRSSQIFSVSGLPDVKLTKHKDESGEWKYRAHLLGVDLFDPVSMEVEHYGGDEAADQQRVPAWFLDVDYNDLCFHVSQAFFPRTSAWDNLKRSLRGTFEDSVWSHLAGMSSEPFFAGEHQQVAVKVIDDRGNELMVVAKLSDAAIEKSTGEKV